MNKISLDKMAALIHDYFTPLDIFHVDDMLVRLVKIKGKYHWHKHSGQDELFLVLKGKLKLNFKDGQLLLEPGEGFVVKNGTMHQSEADEETLVLLVENANIVTKGD